MTTRFIACTDCGRHVRQGDPSCPFCGIAAPLAPPSRGYVLMPGMPRAAMLAAGTALPLLVSALVDCSSSSPSAVAFYGVAACEPDASCQITMDAAADGPAADGDVTPDSALPDTGSPEAASDAGDAGEAGDAVTGTGTFSWGLLGGPPSALRAEPPAARLRRSVVIRTTRGDGEARLSARAFAQRRRSPAGRGGGGSLRSNVGSRPDCHINVPSGVVGRSPTRAEARTHPATSS